MRLDLVNVRVAQSCLWIMHQKFAYQIFGLLGNLDMSREFKLSSALDVSESVEILCSFEGGRVEKKFVDYNTKGPVVGGICQIAVLKCLW